MEKVCGGVLFMLFLIERLVPALHLGPVSILKDDASLG